MLFCRLLNFFKINFFDFFFKNAFRVSNSLDPDQVRQNVGPDLDPNCLQRLSAEDTGRQRDKRESPLEKDNHFHVFVALIVSLLAGIFACFLTHRWLTKSS